MSGLMALSNFSLPHDIISISNATAIAIAEPSCVCSPLSYTFTIDLSRNCETDTFIDNPGIESTLCLLGSEGGGDVVDWGPAAAAAATVVSVQFLEIDTSAGLNVLNQDDTYLNVSLADGDSVTFDSISANLNPAVPLSSQLEYVPGGVIVIVILQTEEGGEPIRNRLFWAYQMSCETLAPSVGDEFGSITLVSIFSIVTAI